MAQWIKKGARQTVKSPFNSYRTVARSHPLLDPPCCSFRGTGQAVARRGRRSGRRRERHSSRRHCRPLPSVRPLACGACSCRPCPVPLARRVTADRYPLAGTWRMVGRNFLTTPPSPRSRRFPPPPLPLPLSLPIINSSRIKRERADEWVSEQAGTGLPPLLSPTHPSTWSWYDTAASEGNTG